MGANLRIGTVGIPAVATCTTSFSGAIGYEREYLHGSHKADWFRRSSPNINDHRFTYDLGVGVTSTANYLYLGRASMLGPAGVTFVFLRANSTDNYGTAVNYVTVDSTTLAAANLLGPGRDDVLVSFNESPAWRYWYVNVFSPGNSLIPHSKQFFGRGLDLGLDPTDVTLTLRRPAAAMVRSLITLDLQWRGLTEANARTLLTTVGDRRAYHPLVLYTTTYHELLFGHRVLFGRAREVAVVPTATNVFEASMTFEEMP